MNITDTEIREWRRIWPLETDHEPLLSATCGHEGDDLVEVAAWPLAACEELVLDVPDSSHVAEDEIGVHPH